ncbi:DMT family transporter [Deferribacter autotrophicus]|uniref:DMT family transporter n=1 Tax=Deferribacter autotrophicus TaxID=500465 RepID=A0A5A8F2X0_9BACT|nr:DMT family transporter [Deferribacter autotrophicus]KAA0258347.1 DMT family transporter [Deferribacter autotrophicus]
MENRFLKGIVFSILSALCFASLAIFAKLGYIKGYKTNTLLFYRFFFATLIFFVFILFKDKRLFLIDKTGLLKCFIVGFLFYGLQASFFFLSVKYIGASMTSFILYMYPFVVTVLSVIIFRQRIERIIIATLIVTFTGIVFIFFDMLNFHLPIVGVMFGLLAMLTFSSYLIVVQLFLKDLNSFTFTFYVLLFGTLFFGLFGFNNINILFWNDLFYFVMLGLIPTSLGIILLYVAVDKIGSSLVSIFSTIEPFATLLFSYIFFQERVGFFQLIGGILIISGIILPNIYRMKVYGWENKRVSG